MLKSDTLQNTNVVEMGILKSWVVHYEKYYICWEEQR